MFSRTIGLTIALAGLTALTACSDDDASSDGDTNSNSSSAATSGSGGSGQGGNAQGGQAAQGGGGSGGMAPSVTYTGLISNAIGMAGISGASVCVTEPDLGCVTTDAAGNYVFAGIPINVRARVRAEAPNFFPVEGLIDVAEVDGEQNAVMLGTAVATAAFSGIGVAFDDTKAAISVGVAAPDGTGLAGYTATITPAGGEGPFFPEGFGIANGATATTDVGQAVFINLEAGNYTINVSGPGTCTPFLNEPDNTSPAVINDGALFAAFFTCR